MKEFLSAGEKIKKLRTEIGLTQEDLSNEYVSKSLISMIEKGKRSLTFETAKIIADILNSYYQKMGQPITAEYLMETEETQIKKEITKNLVHLKKGMRSGRADEELLKNTFRRAMDLISMGDFQQELVELKILKGNFYYENFQYKEALVEFLDVLDTSMKVGDYWQVARAYNFLGCIYQMQMIYDNAIVHYVKAYDTARVHDIPNQDEIKAQSMFNQIICYRAIKKYDVALSHIDAFKKLRWTDPLFKVYLNRVILVEANTYRDLENYYSAEQVYHSLLEIRTKLDPETLFLLYENYGLYHRKLGNFSIALEYFDKAFQLRDKVSVKYLSALYLYQSTCYNLFEEYDKIEGLLEEGLLLADLISRKKMMIEIRFAYVEIFIKLGDYETALQQLQIVDKIVLDIVSKPTIYDLYSYYIEIYNKLGNAAKSTEYALKIRQRSYLGY